VTLPVRSLRDDNNIMLLRRSAVRAVSAAPRAALPAPYAGARAGALPKGARWVSTTGVDFDGQVCIVDCCAAAEIPARAVLPR